MRIAVCSGSFDPITLGHMDIIRRTAACFDQVYVCVSPNTEKRGQMFTPKQKLKLVEAAVAELPNVTAELYGGLLSDYAAEHRATAIVRGIRSAGDFDTEYQQAMVNRGLHPGLETLLLPADPAYVYLSSTVARETEEREGECVMAENDVNRLIDMLYERVEDAKSPALKPNLSMVDRDEILDLLDELRSQLPVELKRAQELLAAREKFVDEAKRDVERMMRQADLEAKSKISDSEVLYAAKEKARKIIADAEDRSRQLCQVANEYAEDALARTEEAVQAALTEVKQSRSAFRAASAAKRQEQREKLDAGKKNAEQPES